MWGRGARARDGDPGDRPAGGAGRGCGGVGSSEGAADAGARAVGRGCRAWGAVGVERGGPPWGRLWPQLVSAAQGPAGRVTSALEGGVRDTREDGGPEGEVGGVWGDDVPSEAERGRLSVRGSR